MVLQSADHAASTEAQESLRSMLPVGIFFRVQKAFRYIICLVSSRHSEENGTCRCCTLCLPLSV